MPAADWDALVDDDDPRFLFAHRAQRLVGAVPLYLMTDSMGEFIWGFAWAAWSNRRPIPYREAPGQSVSEKHQRSGLETQNEAVAGLREAPSPSPLGGCQSPSDFPAGRYRFSVALFASAADAIARAPVLRNAAADFELPATGDVVVIETD